MAARCSWCGSDVWPVGIDWQDDRAKLRCAASPTGLHRGPGYRPAPEIRAEEQADRARRAGEWSATISDAVCAPEGWIDG